MKASELMIGDWVLINGVPRKIEAVDGVDNEIMADDEIYCLAEDRYHSEDKVIGIPLTPEILEKNGFKMAKWKEDEPAGLLGKWWDNSGQVLVKRFDFTLLGEVYSVNANNSRISNIRYVHELQHALRLCGIEKEIEL